ncbi:MAG: PQQ-like beta-propeller repeat protein [Deltaproteobacteria bacterium]|nr:PQQ-like beta-propeller repeat protein [Deltaproteobacteria bacterium]
MLFLLLPLASLQAEAPNWHQWRGPDANGVAPASDPPIEWSEEKNLRWKVPIPGKGHASPVIWEDRIFLATAIATEKPALDLYHPEVEANNPRSRRRGIQPTHVQRFVVLALDRATGKTVWQHTARESAPHEGTHLDATWASASPITDGEHLFVTFGSNGLYAYDLAGKLLWEKDLGDMQTRNGFGEGSSPALQGNTLVITWDHEGESFIVALDKRTGAELWRQPRAEATSWATPLIVESGGKHQVVVNGTGKIRGYDLANGKILWESGGMTTNTIPSPVHKDGVVYVMSGFRGNALQAIQLANAKGDLGDSEAAPGALLWTYDRDTPYVPSPLLYDDKLYFLKSNSNVLSVLSSDTGEVLYGPQRLEGIDGIYSSPVGAGGRVYVVGRNGKTLVLRHGPKLEILATNQLDDSFDSSPAISGEEIFLRGGQNLYLIAPDPVSKAKPPSKAHQEETREPATTVESVR